MNEILGYVGAVSIGVILGLIGGGGSILTVPILTYVLLIDPVMATAYSLFVVGTTSLVGTIRNAQKKMIDWKTGIVFAIPAFISVYATRKFIIPAIPDELFTIQDFTLNKGDGIMVLFGIIMLLASYSMIRNKTRPADAPEKPKDPKPFNFPAILAEGLVVGVLTGLVGAGGGFLIIPALVLLAKIPMKTAVATSLFIIATKSLIGFVGDVQNLDIDWTFLLSFTGLSIIGIFLGIYLNKFIPGKSLKKAFGWFVLIMGIYIILRESVFA